VVGTQTTSARASGSQNSVVISMDETEEHEDTTPLEVTSGKKKMR
jgi:hypothetical protein